MAAPVLQGINVHASTELLKMVQDAVDGKISVRELSVQLKRLQAALTNPLSDPPRKDDDRKKLEQSEKTSIMIGGESRTRSKDFITTSQSVAEQLGVNELYAAELVASARKQSHRYGENFQQTAIAFYHQERDAQLSALLLLIKLRLNEANPELQKASVAFTDDLIHADRAGLASRLVDLIRILSEQLQRASQAEAAEYIRKHLTNQRRTVAECLFYIHYDVAAVRTAEVVALLERAMQCGIACRSPVDADQDAFQVAVIMVMAVLAAFQRERRDDAFIHEIDKELGKSQGEQPHVLGFQGIMKWAWAVHCHMVGKERDFYAMNLDDAIKQDAFKFMTEKMLPSREFVAGQENADFFHAMLDQVLTNFLVRMQDEARRLRELFHNETLEEMRAGQPDPYSFFNRSLAAPHVPRYDFEKLLRFISRLYKDQPALASKYWEPPPTEDGDDVFEKLHVFLRMSGEFISAKLFVAHCDMLGALANSPESAERCWAYLCSTTNPNVQWDYFFYILDKYNCDLQYEDANQSLSMRKEIRPEDSETLCAINRVMQAVLKGYPESRGLMLANSNWQNLTTLFGLLASSVPTALKAEVLRTVAAFAKSPEIANRVWYVLEDVGLLPPATAGQKGGIRFELEEIESRSEEYSEVLAFLALIEELIKSGIPQNLGAGYRTPGFQPYLTFIVDNVWLKFDTRGYRLPAQKWQVASAAMRVFYGILSRYDVSASDFQESYIQIQGQQTATHKPPGFELLRALLSGGEFFRKAMSVIEYGEKTLEDERFKPGGDAFEETAILTFKVLELGFNKEPEFLAQQRATASAIFVSSLDRLFQAEKGKVVKVAEYVAYPYNNELCYYSVKVLFWLSQRGCPLVNIMLAAGAADAVIEKYAAKLEEDTDPEATAPEGLEDEGYRGNGVRLAILELLLGNVDQPTPSIMHLLLGFDVDVGKKIESSKLHTVAHSCLHVILDLLRQEGFFEYYPSVAECCVELLSRVCADKRTSEPMLRFLRSREQDYFHTMFAMLRPVRDERGRYAVNAINQQGWILRSVALELHMTGGPASPHRLRAQRLLGLVFSTTIPALAEGEEEEMDGGPEQPRMHMLELLEGVEFTLPDPPLPRSVSDIDLTPTRGVDARGVPRYDVAAVHQLLNQAKRRMEMDGYPAGTMPADVQTVLRAVVDWNAWHQIFAAKLRLLDAWSQILETTLAECYDILHADPKTRELVLHDLLGVVLSYVARPTTRTPMAQRMAPVVMSIMAKLREQRAALTMDEMRVGPLLGVARGITAGILRNDTSQPLRGYLYSTLMNYLQFTSPKPRPGSSSGRNANPTRAQLQLQAGNREVFGTAGTRLLNVVCRDAIEGDDWWRAVAFSTLDVLEGAGVLPSSLASGASDRGYATHAQYLQHFLDTIGRGDAALRAVLAPGPDSLNQLYIYECKMALLIRLAQTPAGAAALLDFGFLRQLVSCQYVDHRPEMTATDYNGFIPPSFERYHQLLLPVLEGVVAVLTALSANDREHAHKGAIDQTLAFLSAHNELVITLLKDRNQPITLASLKELRMLTAIFYHLANHQDAVRKSLPGYAKVEMLLLGLLSKYSLPARWQSQLSPVTAYERERDRMPAEDGSVSLSAFQRDAQMQTLDICRNLVGYCSVVTSMDGTLRVLFAPSLNAPSFDHDVPLAPRAPSLAVLTLYLHHQAQALAKALQDHETLTKRLMRLDTMSVDRLEDLGADGRDGGVTAEERLAAAELRLGTMVDEKAREIEGLMYILENAFLVALRHLRYFLVEYVPAPSAARDRDAESTLPSQNEISSLRRETYSSLSPIIGILSKLDEDRGKFLHFLIRQAKELLRSAVDTGSTGYPSTFDGGRSAGPLGLSLLDR